MIDSKSSSPLDQGALVKLMQPEISRSELQERNRAVEKVAKVGGDQHAATMQYLEQRAGQMAAQGLAASDEVSAEEAKKLAHAETAADQDVSSEAGKQLHADIIAGSESASTEETKKQISNEKAAKQDSVDLDALLEQAEAEVAAAVEGASTEELLKMAKEVGLEAMENASIEELKREVIARKAAELAKERADILATSQQSGNGNIDESFFHPGQGGMNDDMIGFPLDPPKPPGQFPDGFDIDSLYQGSSHDPHTVMTKIMLQFADSMKKGVESRIEANKEFTLATNELQQESVELKAQEQIDQLESSQQAAKAGNCISIVVTVVMTVLSVALAVVTGGAASALIGLGITALFLVIDMSMMAAGVEPLSSMIMGPIMEHVIMPVITAIAGAIQDLLMLLFPNMDENLAQLLGMIFGSIALIVGVVAMVMLAKNSTVLTSFMSKIGDKLTMAVGKMTPNFLRTAATNVSNGFGRMSSTLLTKLNAGGAQTAGQAAFQRAMSSGISREGAEMLAQEAAGTALEQFAKEAGKKVQFYMMAGGGVGALGSGAAGIAGAEYSRQLSTTRSEMEEIMYQMLVSSEDLASLSDKLREAYEKINDLMTLAYEETKGRVTASKAILNNIALGV